MSMIVILVLIILSYIFFNLTIGLLFFSIKYMLSKQITLSKKELFVLLLYPVDGCGNWMYKKELNELGATKFPRKWFLWKYRLYMYILYLIFLAIIGIFFFGILKGDLNNSYFSDNYNNVFEFFVGVTFDLIGSVFSMVEWFFTTVIFIFSYVIMSLFLIIISIAEKKTIERNHNEEEAQQEMLEKMNNNN